MHKRPQAHIQWVAHQLTTIKIHDPRQRRTEGKKINYCRLFFDGSSSLSFCCLVYIHSMIFGTRQHFIFLRSFFFSSFSPSPFLLVIVMFGVFLPLPAHHFKYINGWTFLAVTVVSYALRIPMICFAVVPYCLCCIRFAAAFDKWKRIFLNKRWINARPERKQANKILDRKSTYSEVYTHWNRTGKAEHKNSLWICIDYTISLFIVYCLHLWLSFAKIIKKDEKTKF